MSAAEVTSLSASSKSAEEMEKEERSGATVAWGGNGAISGWGTGTGVGVIWVGEEGGAGEEGGEREFELSETSCIGE